MVAGKKNLKRELLTKIYQRFGLQELLATWLISSHSLSLSLSFCLSLSLCLCSKVSFGSFVQVMPYVCGALSIIALQPNGSKWIELNYSTEDGAREIASGWVGLPPFRLNVIKFVALLQMIFSVELNSSLRSSNGLIYDDVVAFGLGPNSAPFWHRLFAPPPAWRGMT